MSRLSSKALLGASVDFINYYTPGRESVSSKKNISIIDPEQLIGADGQPNEVEPGEMPKVLHRRHIQMIANDRDRWCDW